MELFIPPSGPLQVRPKRTVVGTTVALYNQPSLAFSTSLMTAHRPQLDPNATISNPTNRFSSAVFHHFALPFCSAFLSLPTKPTIPSHRTGALLHNISHGGIRLCSIRLWPGARSGDCFSCRRAHRGHREACTLWRRLVESTFTLFFV